MIVIMTVDDDFGCDDNLQRLHDEDHRRSRNQLPQASLVALFVMLQCWVAPSDQGQI